MQGENKNTQFNTNIESITQVLTKVIKIPKLQLFHENTNIILKFLGRIPKSNKMRSYFDKNEPGVIKENSIIINGYKYYCTEKLWDQFHKIIISKIDITENNGQTNKNTGKIKTTNLQTRIKQAFERINNSKNIMYKGIYMNIMAFSQFDIFIHHLITNYMLIEKMKEDPIKRTRFDYQIASCIISFVIENMPGLENIFNCFKVSKEVTTTEIKQICAFAEILMINPEASKIKSVFETLNISDTKLQEILRAYFEDLFHNNYKKGTIYITELKDIMLKNKELTEIMKDKELLEIMKDKELTEIMKNKKVTNSIKESDKSDITEHLIKLGDFLTSYLVEEKIFEEDFTKIENQKIHILKPNKEILDAMQNVSLYHKPFLIEKQLKNLGKKSKKDRLYFIINEQLNQFVHSNPRLSITINEKSYLKKENTTYKKYGIYQNYLLFLLQYLGSDLNETLDYHCLSAIYELGDLEKLTEDLLNIPSDNLKNKLQEIYTFLFQELKDFSNCRTANQAVDYIQQVYQYDVTLYNDKYNQALKDLINKIFQRKCLLVSLINDAILLCLFESFIHTTFIDARGRYYLNASSTNIHTHLAAKLFIRMVDDTYQTPPTIEAFNVIKAHMNFNSTKDKIDKFIAENYHINYKQENTQRILKYVENFLKPKEQYPSNIRFDITTVLEEPLYNETIFLLWDLSLVIKKPKRLFYVHSLLLYERERIKNKHPKHLINYYELDASSSGLQMISGLFRSTQLAKMCHLISHKETRDIYFAMTQMFLDTWSTFMFHIEACFYRFPTNLCDFHYKQPTLLDREAIRKENLPEYETDLRQWVTNGLYLNGKFDLTFLLNIMKSSPSTAFGKKSSRSYFGHIPPRKEMFDLLSLQDKKDYQKIIKNPLLEHDFSNEFIKSLFILRMIMRLDWITNDCFNIKIADFANDRELFKKAIMTYFYKSTPHGRKEDYMNYFHTKYPITGLDEMKSELDEFINFLDRFFLNKLQQIPDVTLMNQLIANMNLKEPIIIINKNFQISIDPKIQIRKQVQCPNIKGKRGLQLTILKRTNDMDTTKMKSMLGANIIHSMDANIVHLFNELIYNINDDLIKMKLPFKLFQDTNHDCFYLSCPFLLRVFIEDCYLTCFSSNYIDGISGIAPDVKDLLLQMPLDDFVKALTPINDNFIK